ncbi:MAG: hypothetical protein NXY57DRAFT_1044183 [Lentinula lateritia]|uniref:SHSP domain-containing protein n=1 Tax=Lentinula lateritia TaxID=40482 RepID=A0ABQ8UYK5_9AGAR|nr:MAG: hypothetical protein NXY57DRAFT_1044183 [Lentinula lateritia]KAJ4464283.1 hypothetical protein C8R41DRAFT_872180 [Lentinula lateritia]
MSELQSLCSVPVRLPLDFEAMIQLLRKHSSTYMVPKMDCYYDGDHNRVQVYIELPGVCRENFKGSTTTSSDDGNNLMAPACVPSMALKCGYGLPPHFTTQERKYGEFLRFLPVPATTMAKDIHAELDAGILMVSFPCRKPLTEAEYKFLQEEIKIE